MTREDAKKILLVLKAVYPAMQVSSVLVDVWCAILGAQSYETVHAATLRYLSEPHEFAPTPGQIKAYIPRPESTRLVELAWDPDAMNGKGAMRRNEISKHEASAIIKRLQLQGVPIK